MENYTPVKNFFSGHATKLRKIRHLPEAWRGKTPWAATSAWRGRKGRRGLPGQWGWGAGPAVRVKSLAFVDFSAGNGGNDAKIM
jgi:hypothetical protein